MPDIRKNPTTKDFFLYPTGSLFDGSPPITRWVCSDNGIWTPCQLGGGVATMTHKLGSGSSMSSWIDEPALDGDDQEVWARAVGGGAISGIAWGIALFKDVNGSGAVDGYRMRWEAPGPPYVLYKWTNGSNVTLATSAGTNAMASHYVLLRRNGNAIEGWVSDNPNDASSWTLQISANDTTYMTGLYPSLGETDNGGGQILGWQEFGSGPLEETFRPQVYRRTIGVA